MKTENRKHFNSEKTLSKHNSANKSETYKTCPGFFSQLLQEGKPVIRTITAKNSYKLPSDNSFKTILNNIV